MKKLYFVIFIAFSLLIFNCRPSIISDEKIEAKFIYTSDQAALLGIFGDIIHFPLDEYFDYIDLKDNETKSIMVELAEMFKESFYEEEEEIGKWLKNKFKSELRRGEVIRITYRYNNEKDGFDMIYRPYNNEIFPLDYISIHDFVSLLDGSISNKPVNNRSTNKPTSTFNNLTNTTWQSYEDSRIVISFGETSFSFTYLVWVGTLNSPDGLGERKMSGSYIKMVILLI